MNKTRISANYIDRRSSKKWMAREQGQLTSEAVAASFIEATDVVFVTSDSDERALGCELVGITQADVKLTIGSGESISVKGLSRLEFGCGRLYVVGTFNIVTKASRVVLTPHGIYAEV